MSERADLDPVTRLIHGPPAPETLARTVGPPLQRGSTVLMPTAADLYDYSQITYGRQGLATHDALKAGLAELEGGIGCELYPSGAAAISGAMLAVLRAGDEVLVVDSCYAPTRRLCETVLARYGVKTRYYAPRLSAEEILALGGERLRLIVLESPGSLTFEMQDVAQVAKAARARGVLTLIDNTWGAGLLFRPLDHGVDISVQALTKYVCGTSDVFMGSACAREPSVMKRLTDGVLHLGWAVSPDDAYQALRGLRTLALRLERHGENGLAVARWLEARPEVIEVLHPALPSSPDHALWRRDYSGCCGLFGVVLQPARAEAVAALLDALALFGLGFSWGGFESLAISAGEQLSIRAERPVMAGPLLRLHVGLETVEDLVADLDNGLRAFRGAA